MTATRRFRNVSNISQGIGQISTDRALMSMTDPINADTFNGMRLKHLGDKVLLVEYVWHPDDKRLGYDAKLITFKTSPFSATIAAYDAGGIDANVNTHATLDSANGLEDTNDALINMLKLRGNNSDAVAATLVNTTHSLCSQRASIAHRISCTPSYLILKI